MSKYCPHCSPDKFPMTGTPVYGCPCQCHTPQPNKCKGNVHISKADGTHCLDCGKLLVEPNGASTSDDLDDLIKLVYKILRSNKEGFAGETKLKVAKAAILSQYEQRMQEEDGCPCLLVEPCSYACTCAKPLMSGGCMRCCKYGSKEQRLKAAQCLALKAVKKESSENT